MKHSIKNGFGFMLGATLANICTTVAVRLMYTLMAKDKDFVEYEKEHNPEVYEELKKYI